MPVHSNNEYELRHIFSNCMTVDSLPIIWKYKYTFNLVHWIEWVINCDDQNYFSSDKLEYFLFCALLWLHMLIIYCNVWYVFVFPTVCWNNVFYWFWSGGFPPKCTSDLRGVNESCGLHASHSSLKYSPVSSFSGELMQILLDTNERIWVIWDSPAWCAWLLVLLLKVSCCSSLRPMNNSFSL